MQARIILGVQCLNVYFFGYNIGQTGSENYDQLLLKQWNYYKICETFYNSQS